MILNRREGRSPLDEPSELFHAHLEVLVHLLRDEVRWNGAGVDVPSGSEVSSADNGSHTRSSGRVTRFLRTERLRLLNQQRSTLEREARLRVMGERLVPRLENDPGLETRDAVAVAWFYRTEVESRQRERRSEDNGDASGKAPANATLETEALLREIGDAHARLLNGVDSFLPGPAPYRFGGGFPMAVAVAATRLARKRKGEPGETTWMDVEPLARRILCATGGRGTDATPA